MYTVVQKWGNSHGIRLPKTLLEELNIRENDRVEITRQDNTISIKKAAVHPHKTLEERLTAYYGKPLGEIKRLDDCPEVDWGKPEGDEAW